MRSAPSITLYDLAGASAKVSMAAGDAIAGTANQIGDAGFYTDSTNGVVSTQRLLVFHYVAVSEL